MWYLEVMACLKRNCDLCYELIGENKSSIKKGVVPRPHLPRPEDSEGHRGGYRSLQPRTRVHPIQV